MAVFDAVVNNADRKGGHIIPMPAGHVYGVDHGICFSVEPKLRTLLWRWAGKPLPDDAVEVLERLGDELRGDLGEELHEHLTRREVRAPSSGSPSCCAPAATPSPAATGPRCPGRRSSVPAEPRGRWAFRGRLQLAPRSLDGPS